MNSSMQNGFMRPKIMLIGKNGQIGWELRHTLAPLGQVTALDRSQLNLAHPDQIRRCVREIKPDIIVNAAAYTAVDKAEEDLKTAIAVNTIAPGIMAEEAKRLSALIVHYSTDFVFDGKKNKPYVERTVYAGRLASVKNSVVRTGINLTESEHNPWLRSKIALAKPYLLVCPRAVK